MPMIAVTRRIRENRLARAIVTDLLRVADRLRATGIQPIRAVASKWSL
ncbi:hypothetical protein AB0M47_28605 [Hamadaea sp. NPDC051192]